MNKWVLGLSLIAAMATGASQAADAEAGKTKSAMCAACHGADGNSINPIWPNLAGQHANYIAKQLSEFKSGARQDATMQGMAAALSEQDMADIGAYFASQQAKGGQAAADQVAKGEMIYRAGIQAKGVAACTACHGPTGQGVQPSAFPAVSGQHSAYVEKQLKDFAAGARNNDANQMMRNIASKLSPAEMTAVAQYMQGLK
ncbi:MAG: c-type cytochrome [Chromatiales bacterium]|jgi:cytochrome c553